MDADTAQKLADLKIRSEKERKRHHARKPKPAAGVVARVMAKRGYAASKASEELNDQWQSVATRVLTDPKVATQTRAAGLSRGRLEVLVSSHVVMQEATFFRPQLLAEARKAMPEARITAIRFKVANF